jgi:heme A synthase
MVALRRVGWVALALAFGQIVFGAIVRITGSGMGCGDDWPQCAGYWIPPLQRPDLIIEVTHRYIAAGLTLTVIAMVATALVMRHLPGVAGRGGVLRATLLAATLVVVAALFGAATVKLELSNKAVIVTHLAIAMALLAVLLVAIDRTREAPRPYLHQPAAGGGGGVSLRTLRTAYSAAGLVFLALVLGALTAHIPGANTACTGFPLCSGALFPTAPAQHVQYAHRVVALLLFLHVGAIAYGTARRGETAVVGLARLTFGVIVLQIVIAAFLVERNLPLLLRSLHEAVGTLIWVLVVSLSIVARRHAPATKAAQGLASVAVTAEASA